MHASTKLSIWTARIITLLFILAFVVLAVILPALVRNFCDTPDLIGDRTQITDFEYGVLVGLSYVAVGVAIIVMAFLLVLLQRVADGRVFDPSMQRPITAIILCCIVEAILFSVISIYFQLAIAIVLMVLLLALCLSVMQSVLREAIRIKTENDFTV